MQSLTTKILIIFHALSCEISYITNLECVNPVAKGVDKAEITSIWLLANRCH